MCRMPSTRPTREATAGPTGDGHRCAVPARWSGSRCSRSRSSRRPATRRAPRPTSRRPRRRSRPATSTRAEASVQSARRHADEVQGAMQGIGGDIWSLLPVVGRPVADVRHLGNALDHLTVGRRGRARGVAGGERGRRHPVRRPVRSTCRPCAVGGARGRRGQRQLDTAQLELGEVSDSALGVGTRLAEARDEATDVVAPARGDAPDAPSSWPRCCPTSSAPRATGPTCWPCSTRASSASPAARRSPWCRWRSRTAQLTMGDARDTSDPDLFRVGRWEKVEGNPFHNGKLRLSTATFAPDWSVSGEELLRGLGAAHRPGGRRPRRGRRRRARRHAADHRPRRGPALRHPRRLELHPEARRRLRHLPRQRRPPGPQPGDRARVRRPRLRARATAWRRSSRCAARRRPATSRSGCATPTLQAAVADIGLAGDLSDTDHDYIAVFNQNTNISKSDYWQRRTVTSDVRLREDGSAKVELTISVFNDSPPYGANQIYGDNRGGSNRTRWNGMTVGVFLPEGVEDHQRHRRAASQSARAPSTTTAAPTSCSGSSCLRARRARRC